MITAKGHNLARLYERGVRSPSRKGTLRTAGLLPPMAGSGLPPGMRLALAEQAPPGPWV